MRNAEHLVYGRTIYSPRRNSAAPLRSLGRYIEGLFALAIIVSLALGSTYLFGVILGCGIRFGYALWERVF